MSKAKKAYKATKAWTKKAQSPTRWIYPVLTIIGVVTITAALVG